MPNRLGTHGGNVQEKRQLVLSMEKRAHGSWLPLVSTPRQRVSKCHRKTSNAPHGPLVPITDNGVVGREMRKRGSIKAD